ncbi:MAG TPA: hypothetical protein VM580_24065 [Labilithrix sp.]|nr:hypothetical protein [Labilithrix sp.]
MHRDVTHLRNIGILASVDAGNVTWRKRIFELIGGGGMTDDESLDGPLLGRGVSPASSGTWTPRSGPFAEVPISFNIVACAPRVFDGTVVVLDGARGSAETAEAALRDMCARRVPCIVFVDDVGGIDDLEAMVDALESDLGITSVPVHLPWNDLQGAHVIDVLEQRLVISPEGAGKRHLRPVPAEVEETVARIRRRIVDICAEVDDGIHGASAAGLDVGADELARALRKATLACEARVLVVTCGSLRARRGVGLLLDALSTYLPSPAERPPVFGLDPRRSLTVARFAREGDALSATVFATTELPAVGKLTWIRVHSGRVDVSAKVTVLPRNATARIERIFLPDVRGLLEVNTAGPGDVVCVTGADASAGDTISCVRAPVVLDDSHAPRRAAPSPPTVDSVAPRRTRASWSVARGVQSRPVADSGLRRSRG